MPSCAVITCRLASKDFNLNKGGISYHRFPGDPPTRQKWIDATGRRDWIPTKTSTICSKHFLESDLCTTPHKRYLKLCVIPQIEIVSLHSVVKNETAPSTSTPQATSSESPKRLTTKDRVIKRQRKQIKTLQAQTRRLKMKVKKLEDMLDKLQQKSLLQSKEVSLP